MKACNNCIFWKKDCLKDEDDNSGHCHYLPFLVARPGDSVCNHHVSAGTKK